MASQPIRLGSSSIDVANTVKLLTVKRRESTDKALALQRSATATRISAIGNFTASLSQLQSAVKGLSDGSAFAARKTTVGDPSVVAAVAHVSALPSTYHLVVARVAVAQSTTSAALGDGKTPLGTGRLTIAVGARSMSLAFVAPTNTLEHVRARINDAPDNPE